MSLELNVRTLAHCTRQLGSRLDASDTIDEGFLLLQSVADDTKLCEKVAEKLSGFGDVLTDAKDAYKEATTLIRTRSAKHLEGLTDLKERLEEWSLLPVVSALRQFSETLEAMDAKLETAEVTFGRLESYSRCLHMECAKHGRAITTAGGLFLASGCLALTLSAATFLIKCAVQSTGGAMSPAAALIFRFSPWNTALAGGIVTMLGVSDTRNSQRYSKMTLDFRDFADDLQRDISNSRSFRTRIQRLKHAVDDMALSLHVQTAVNKVDGTIWNLLIEWIPIQEQALNDLARPGPNIFQNI